MGKYYQSEATELLELLNKSFLTDDESRRMAYLWDNRLFIKTLLESYLETSL